GKELAAERERSAMAGKRLREVGDELADLRARQDTLRREASDERVRHQATAARLALAEKDLTVARVELAAARKTMADAGTAREAALQELTAERERGAAASRRLQEAAEQLAEARTKRTA